MPSNLVNRVGKRKTGRELDERCEDIIRVLREHPEGIGFNELARKLRDVMSRPTLSERLRVLERAGILIVERGRQGQKYRIFLSEQAKRLASFLDELEVIERKVIFCIKVLQYEFENEVKDSKTISERILKLVDHLLRLLLALLLMPGSDVPKEAIDLVSLRVLRLIRRTLIEPIRSSPLLPLIESLEPYLEFRDARKELEAFCNQLLREAKELGIIESLQ